MGPFLIGGDREGDETVLTLESSFTGSRFISNKDFVQGNRNISIRDNRFTSVNDEAISLFGWLGEVANITVQGNTVRAHGASFGVAAYGIDSKNQTGRIHDVRIIDNVISGGRIGGIGVKGGAQAVEVAGNFIENTEGDGIFMHTGGEGLPGVQDIRIHQNNIMNAGRHGMFASRVNIEVKENKISKFGQSGVFAAGLVSVIDNVITDAKPGILVYGGQEDSIVGNKLSNDGRILILDKDGAVLKDIVTGL